MLSIYTRHRPDCKNADDKTRQRCNRHKWILGSLNGKFIRQSARTHLLDKIAKNYEILCDSGRPLTGRASADTSKAGPGMISRMPQEAFKWTNQCSSECPKKVKRFPPRCDEN
jgi:hypothetical protein